MRYRKGFFCVCEAPNEKKVALAVLADCWRRRRCKLPTRKASNHAGLSYLLAMLAIRYQNLKIILCKYIVLQCKIWRVLSAHPRRRRMDLNSCWHSQHCQQTGVDSLPRAICWQCWLSKSNSQHCQQTDGRMAMRHANRRQARDAAPTCVGIANIANKFVSLL